MPALAILIVVGVIAIIVLAIYFSPDRRVLRKLRATPLLPCAQVAEGQEARIAGTVGVFEATLTAPLTGRQCVYFRVTVTEERGSGKNRRTVTIIDEIRGVPFVVSDATGRAIIDPSKAKVALDMDGKSRSGTFDNATEAENALLARHGKSSGGIIFNKALTYREGVIEPGEQVAVAGSGVREPDPQAVAQAGAYREGAPTLLRLTSSAKFPLQLTDRVDKL